MVTDGLATALSPPPAILATFGADGSPAVLRRALGSGSAVYAAFLPGLSYFRPALPRAMPVDRGASDGSGSHFIPHAFAAAVLEDVVPGREAHTRGGSGGGA